MWRARSSLESQTPMDQWPGNLWHRGGERKTASIFSPSEFRSQCKGLCGDLDFPQHTFTLRLHSSHLPPRVHTHTRTHGHTHKVSITKMPILTNPNLHSARRPLVLNVLWKSCASLRANMLRPKSRWGWKFEHFVETLQSELRWLCIFFLFIIFFKGQQVWGFRLQNMLSSVIQWVPELWAHNNKLSSCHVKFKQSSEFDFKLILHCRNVSYDASRPLKL